MDNTKDVYLRLARHELTEQVIYSRLAAREKNPTNRTLLEKLSAKEKEHYLFWQRLATASDISPSRFRPVIFDLMRTFLGITFTVKFLEKQQAVTEDGCQLILKAASPELQADIRRVIADGQTEEAALIDQIKEGRVMYLSFIVLGLADAIVEITGVHAGFLGVTSSTLMAGISGLIVGFAAAVSMAAAAYLQAKQNASYKPIVSAFSTGITYIISIILLALPYFWLGKMGVAFVASTAVGAFLIAAFTYYGAIVFGRKFWREFLEATGLMLGTAVATFFVGKIIGAFFGLDGAMF